MRCAKPASGTSVNGFRDLATVTRPWRASSSSAPPQIAPMRPICCVGTCAPRLRIVQTRRDSPAVGRGPLSKLRCSAPALHLSHPEPICRHIPESAQPSPRRRGSGTSPEATTVAAVGTSFGEEGRRRSYGSYLKIPELLRLQQRLTEAHDELLFIIVHQAYELWFRELIHELEAVRDRMLAGEVFWVRHFLNR